MKELTPRQRALLEARYQKGMTYEQISAAFGGISFGAISKQLRDVRRKAGIKYPGKSPEELKAYHDRVFSLHDKGMSIRKIAAELGRGKTTIQDILNRRDTRQTAAAPTPLLRYEDADVSGDTSLHILIYGANKARRANARMGVMG